MQMLFDFALFLIIWPTYNQHAFIDSSVNFDAQKKFMFSGCGLFSMS
jgi:hypothetical protein